MDVTSFASFSCPVPLPHLQRDVEQLIASHWVDHVNKNDYLGGWDLLPLRCKREHKNAHPILQGLDLEAGNTWVNLPVLQQSNALLQAIGALDCPIKSVRLMRLKPRAHIKPHCDKGLCMEEGEARLHLPIFTNEKIDFFVNNRRVPMTPDQFWYINADQLHEVKNNSNEDRINLVIDCVVNDWLTQKILNNE